MPIVRVTNTGMQWSKIFDERPIDFLIESDPHERAVIAGGVLVILYLSWKFAGCITTNTSQQIDFFNSIINLLLTGGLLWIYLNIARETKKQRQETAKQVGFQKDLADIQKEQKKLLEADYTPVLVVSHIFAQENSPIDCTAGNVISLDILNLGKSIAKNLCLRVIFDCSTRMEELGLLLGPRDNPLINLDHSESFKVEQGGVLQPDPNGSQFHACTSLSVYLETEEAIGLDRALLELKSSGAKSARIGLILKYEDKKGDTHEIDLEGREVDLGNFSEENKPTFNNIRSEKKVSVEFVREGWMQKGFPNPPEYVRR